jgi:CRP/FNR family transcriptional regulator, anaerobic regulatory protein
MDTKLENQLNNFFAHYPLRTFTKGEIIIWAGDEPKGIVYLIKGCVSQYDISDAGQKFSLNIFKPPAFFPMSWALNKTPNKYFFEAIENVKCRIAPAEDVIDLLKSNSEISLDLLSRVYKGTDGMLQRISQLMVGSASSQLFLEIVISALRFGQIDENGSHNISIKTTELAERTGMARETISRELKKLEDQKLITRKKGFIIIANNEQFNNL